MIKNFLTIATRVFLRQPVQSLLNIVGLAIGLASALYVFLYIYNEYTYDTQHPDPSNTYRIVSKWKYENGEEETGGFGNLGWANYLQNNFDGIKNYALISKWGFPFSFHATADNGDKKVILSEDVSIVSKNYPELFYLNLVEGDLSSIFSQPTDILISASAARELFGDESAVGQHIQVNHPYFLESKKTDVEVKGVFEDFPYNIQFGRSTKYMLNMELQRLRMEANDVKFEDALTALAWPAIGGSIYIHTEPGTDLSLMGSSLKEEINKTIESKGESYSVTDISFLKITDTHFSEIPGLVWPEMGGNKKYVFIFLVLGIFILLISCINHINLSTARSIRRNKEVGVRKASGSSKSQLIFQFLFESFLTVGIAIILAMIIAMIFLPKFSAFASKDFAIADLFDPVSLLMLLLLWLAVSFLAGLYPAFHISSLNIVNTLKDARGTGKSGNTLRQFLMVFQFATSVALIFFTWVVISQMNDMINNDLNKAGDQILSIRYGNSAPVNKLEVLRNELAKDPELVNSSYGNHLPRREGYTQLTFEASLPHKDEKKYQWEMMCVGPGFPKLYGLELVAGNMFETDLPIDSTEVLVNEEVARQLNMEVGELVGEMIVLKDEWENKEYNFRIRGVLKDFQYKSAYTKIDPLVLSVQRDRANDIIFYVKLPAGKIQEKIAVVEKTWKTVMPEDVGLSHWFVNDEFDRLYVEENALYDLSKVFTVLGILTTCIGLFGMAIFMVERKDKEMAIRKVMGASSAQVYGMMVLSFLKLAGIASLIALPIAFYFSTKWLQGFIYKIELDWIIPLASVFIILFITLLTISFHSVKIATSNPVNSLRQE